MSIYTVNFLNGLSGQRHSGLWCGKARQYDRPRKKYFALCYPAVSVCYCFHSALCRILYYHWFQKHGCRDNTVIRDLLRVVSNPVQRFEHFH